MAKDYKYPDSTPVDEPVKKPKKQPPTPKAMDDTEMMSSGGSASSRADGCCTKGKTRGKMV
jgi:hypothetical protein